jgi:hypothetical protein
MKAAALFLFVSFALIQAQAAEYKTTFALTNPGVKCDNVDMSRFNGREISLNVDDLSKIGSMSATADGSVIRTEIRDLVTADQSHRCEELKAVPSVLKGTREIYISKMEDAGKCNAYVVEEISVNLGKGNPSISGKTAYPIFAGEDFSAWSKEICNYTELDFNNAIARIVVGK